MNCGDFTACAKVMADCGSPSMAAAALRSANAGGRRMSNAAGIISAAAMPAMMRSDVLQWWFDMIHAANGDMVIGATPMPAETSETARLRWVSNQPVTHAISGAKIAAVAPPIITPKRI